jgi:hypothetical protein
MRSSSIENTLRTTTFMPGVPDFAQEHIRRNMTDMKDSRVIADVVGGTKLSFVTGAASGRPQTNHVRFGSVTFDGVPVSPDEYERAVASGRAALAAARVAFARPGVKLNVPSSVPRFRAHPTIPGHVLRFLDGTETQGTIEGGVFRAT